MNEFTLTTDYHTESSKWETRLSTSEDVCFIGRAEEHGDSRKVAISNYKLVKNGAKTLAEMLDYGLAVDLAKKRPCGEPFKAGGSAAPKDPDHELTEDEVATLASGGALCDCCEWAQADEPYPVKEGDEFDFGSAICLLKEGLKVARKGWNGKDMFLYYVPASAYPAQRNNKATLAGMFPDDMVPYGAYIAMKTAQGNVVPWLASQTDMLAEDWLIVT